MTFLLVVLQYFLLAILNNYHQCWESVYGVKNQNLKAMIVWDIFYIIICLKQVSNWYLNDKDAVFFILFFTRLRDGINTEDNWKTMCAQNVAQQCVPRNGRMNLVATMLCICIVQIAFVLYRLHYLYCTSKEVAKRNIQRLKND